MEDRIFMEEALKLAREAAAEGEVPVGCVIVRGDEVRHGVALDLDSDGGLIVRLDSGEIQTVSSGEVSIRGLYGYI